MTEFTKDDIEHYRKQYALWTSRKQTTPEELHLIGRLRDALDHIEHLQKRVQELEIYNKNFHLACINALDLHRESDVPKLKDIPKIIDELKARVQELEMFQDLVNRWSDQYYRDTNKLKQRIAELEQERRWIPTSERLPKDDGYYYVAFLISGKKYMTDIYYFKLNSEHKWYRDNVHFDVATFYDAVVYWTIRPQPPKDGE